MGSFNSLPMPFKSRSGPTFYFCRGGRWWGWRRSDYPSVVLRDFRLPLRRTMPSLKEEQSPPRRRWSSIAEDDDGVERGGITVVLLFNSAASRHSNPDWTLPPSSKPNHPTQLKAVSISMASNQRPTHPSLNLNVVANKEPPPKHPIEVIARIRESINYFQNGFLLILQFQILNSVVIG